MSRKHSSPLTPTAGRPGETATLPVLCFSDVGLSYRGADQGETLRDVSFALAAGSFHFLTGPSGAGKSSLLRLTYGAQRPTRGVVALFGEDLAALSRRGLAQTRRRIGVVFQDFRLLDHLSAFDNVALPLRIAGRRPKTYREDVAELLDWVGLGERLDALPPTLSGGEKQRLAIARAVVARPELLLADEPTGNVDPQMARRLLRLFIELNRMGATVLIASHDAELAAASGMPRLRLQDGALVRDAPADAPWP
jgi:cell division transport system ATP-binding protein